MCRGPGHIEGLRGGNGPLVGASVPPARQEMDDGVQLGNGQPPIQRDEDGTKPEAGELLLERIGRIVRQHRDVRAGRYAAGLLQMLTNAAMRRSNAR